MNDASQVATAATDKQLITPLAAIRSHITSPTRLLMYHVPSSALMIIHSSHANVLPIDWC